MSEPYVGQIMTAGFSFAPRKWAKCDGAILPIAQNQALFSLLGVQYGGNGTSTFQLPDLRGRSTVGGYPSVDSGWQPDPYVQGTAFGVETVTLGVTQIPLHSHMLTATKSAASDPVPTGKTVLATSDSPIYGAGQGLVGLTGGPLSAAGAAPHPNMQPYTVINICIALSGYFPSRS